MIRINIIIGFIILVLVMGGQAVPVNSDSTEQKTIIPTSDISGLRENAKLQVFKMLQQITCLELAKVRIGTVATHIYVQTLVIV